MRYDGSSSYLRGAADAPPLIRAALWSEAGNPWTELGIDLSAAPLDDEGDLLPAAGEAAATVRDRIEAAVLRIVESNRRPLVLGGDHSITYPVLRGMRSRYPRLAILHFDAHGDLYHEFQGDRYSHACPFARIMEEGLAQRLVQVGIRTVTGHQREQAQPLRGGGDRDEGLARRLHPGVRCRRCTCRSTWMRSSRAWRPGSRTARRVASPYGRRSPSFSRFRGSLVGADFVEFNPAADPTGVTAAVSAKIVKELAARLLVETR